MGDPQMTLREEDIQQIALRVAPTVKQLIAQEELPRINGRIGTVEQELKNIGVALREQGEELRARRELMEARFEAIDTRFEDQRHFLQKRFE
ncbi:MAG: hypothetical protein ACOC8L_07970, partial [Spirochaetota bacterium]